MNRLRHSRQALRSKKAGLIDQPSLYNGAPTRANLPRYPVYDLPPGRSASHQTSRLRLLVSTPDRVHERPIERGPEIDNREAGSAGVTVSPRGDSAARLSTKNGGEGGIRTLEASLTPLTRFPIVRLQPDSATSPGGAPPGFSRGTLHSCEYFGGEGGIRTPEER